MAVLNKCFCVTTYVKIKKKSDNKVNRLTLVFVAAMLIVLIAVPVLADGNDYVYQNGANASYYNTPSINNYVPSTSTYIADSGMSQSQTRLYNQPAATNIGSPTNEVFSGMSQGISPQVASSEYFTINHSPTFRRNGVRTLESRTPSYDHWSNMPDQPWSLQLLPEGLIFPSYLAGMKEPRLGSMWVNDKNFDMVWDAALGGRAGLLRFGSSNSVLPEGIQLDLEGAVLLRMDIEHDRDMMANDFRVGTPLTFGGKKWQFKFGYYHLSSHMGDEYALRTGTPRLNYVRDSIVFAVARRFGDHWRVYGETAWAFFTGDETEPWEFQVGLEYSPISPAHGFRGTPFAAMHLHTFQELDFSGYFCCQAGWQWRGKNNQLLRIGLQYLNGYDDQFEFHNQSTEKIGLGIWYDF